jgi:phosphatidylserine/phosphatidylglycerophosphate/cardiolipin synthase-like enzyme
MSPARARLLQRLREVDLHRRLRIYTPVTGGGDDIYVHSKIMIVDDEMIRVGSANLNNRSMGLDSECDLLIDSREPANSEVGKEIEKLRYDLLAEHLGVEPMQISARFASTGSLIAAVEELRGMGRTLLPLEPERPNKLEAAIADSEALDPESAGEAFEPLARPGLFAGLGASLGFGPRR